MLCFFIIIDEKYLIKMKKKTLIFDLDGTLLNTIDDIASSMNTALKEAGLEKHKTEKYKYFVGSGVDKLTKNAIKNTNTKINPQNISKRFKEIYAKNLYNKTKPYPGIPELLKKLTQHNLSVLSNKPQNLTQKYIEKYFPNTFQKILGQRPGIHIKPNPTAIKEIINHFHTTPENVYLIGDTNIDMQTANNANIKAIGVLWGFRNKKELSENNANYIISKPDEILEIINN